MARSETNVSEQVIYTVAEVHDEDPVDLPRFEKTISSDALNDLFHTENHPPGAYMVFPYYDVWVMVHSNGTVDVFKEYAATSALADFPNDVADITTDEYNVVLHAENDRHIFFEDELETLHDIIEEADDSEKAWENTIDYAEQR